MKYLGHNPNQVNDLATTNYVDLRFADSDIFDRYDVGKTVGPIGGQKALTGQTYVVTGVVTSNVTNAGVLLDSDNTSGSGRAGYNSLQSSRALTYLSTEVAFTAGSAANVATLIAWAAEPGAYSSANGGKAPAACCHFILGVGTWTYAVFDSAGTYAVLAQGTYTAYPQDGTTFRKVSIAIDATTSTAFVQLPDGTTALVTDSRVTSSCPWICLEPYYVDATDGRKPVFRSVTGDGTGSRLQDWLVVKNSARLNALAALNRPTYGTILALG